MRRSATARRPRAAPPRAVSRGARALRGGVLAAVLAVAPSGCATLAGTVDSYRVTPTGLETRDATFRARLLGAVAGAAADFPADVAPRDELLRALYEGSWGLETGDFARAATRLEAAADLADDRFTKSLTQNVVALLTNDRALSYVPSHTERLFAHAYAALAWAQADDPERAAVEARRLTALLQQLEGARTPRDLPLHGAMRLLAAGVFAAAGEANDADVNLRNAQALLGSDSTDLWPLGPPPADSGDVVVFLEQGWGAHKVAQQVVVPVYPGERKAFDGKGSTLEKFSVATTIAARAIALVALAPSQGVWWFDGRPLLVTDYGPVGTARRVERGTELLPVSWPVLRRTETARPAGAAVGGREAPPLAAADVTEAQAADLARDRGPILARAILRVVSKAVAADAAETKATKKWGESTGEFVGTVSRIFGAATERADTRGWWLLPASVSIVRLRLPAGTWPLEAAAGGDRRSLGTVTVRGGRAHVVARRLWSRQFGG